MANRVRNLVERLKLKKDYRESLPPLLTRFIGYRPPGQTAPFEPIPGFRWLRKVPLATEVQAFAFIGSFTAILLVEAIMCTNTAFRDVYHTPMIITSFGASAVLLFGVIEAPVSQPRNFVGGHFLASLVATIITRLFVLNDQYQGYLVNTSFHPSTFVNGALSMATSLLLMLITGTTHPPAGATALNAAVESKVVTLSWHYIPTVLASSLIMLGWALIINNLGRRRYPTYWWSPGRSFVREPVLKDKTDLEDGPQEKKDERQQGDR
jgi:CBS-domain-containing membrane protein